MTYSASVPIGVDLTPEQASEFACFEALLDLVRVTTPASLHAGQQGLHLRTDPPPAQAPAHQGCYAKA